jgi:inner membrane protein
MPTIFSHAFFAGAVAVPFRKSKHFKRLLFAGAICSMLPDADAIGFLFGIPYESVWGHRGITHSAFFALLLSAAITLHFFKQPQLKKSRPVIFFYLFIVTLSHPLLDAFTNGGLGVALLAPFDTARYFFPWRPILVSPMGAGFISTRGLATLLSEFIWIWIPSIILGAISICTNARKNNSVS